MKKKKAIIRWIRCELFNADFVLIVCPKKDFVNEARQVLTKDKIKLLEEKGQKALADDCSLAIQFPFNGGGSIIWGNPKATLGTIVHEVTHAAHHLLDMRSVPLSKDTEEVYAYLVEFLFNSLTKSRK